MLHYKPATGYFGDPIPYYWDGVYHMFYLRTPPDPKRHGADHTCYSHISTRDFLHWKEHPDAIEPTPQGPDALSCWTGSIIEKDGTFYLFYTGHGKGVYEWPQTICLATSPDLDHWEKWPQNPLMTPDPQKFKISDWRDPFVFWSEQDGCYLMSITSMRASDNFWKGGCLVMARSQDLIHWEVDEQPYYHPGNHGYPECSDLFRIGRTWYNVNSIFHKTCYRIADSLHGPWRRARTDCFDGVLNYAAKTLGDESRRFVVGWVRDKLGYTDDGNWEWAGVQAFPRELVQEADGTLFVKLPKEFDAIRGKVALDLLEAAAPKVLFGKAQKQGGALLVEGKPLFAQVECPGAWPAFDLECEFTLDELGHAGVVFHSDGDTHPGYEIAIDLRHRQMVFRKHTDRYHMYACSDIMIEPGERIHLRVIVEGTVVEAFVNDRHALAGRFYHQPEQPRISFYAEEANAKLGSLLVHELAKLEGEEELAGAGVANAQEKL